MLSVIRCVDAPLLTEIGDRCDNRVITSNYHLLQKCGCFIVRVSKNRDEQQTYWVEVLGYDFLASIDFKSCLPCY